MNAKLQAALSHLTASMYQKPVWPISKRVQQTLNFETISGALNRKNRPMNLDWPAAGQKINPLCDSYRTALLKEIHAHVLAHITWILSTIKEWIVYSGLNWQSVTDIQVHAAQMHLLRLKTTGQQGAIHQYST
jgi:hypothetical protein